MISLALTQICKTFKHQGRLEFGRSRNVTQVVWCSWNPKSLITQSDHKDKQDCIHRKTNKDNLNCNTTCHWWPWTPICYTKRNDNKLGLFRLHSRSSKRLNKNLNNFNFTSRCNQLTSSSHNGKCHRGKDFSIIGIKKHRRYICKVYRLTTNTNLNWYRNRGTIVKRKFVITSRKIKPIKIFCES